jgi:hypothetical protein
MDSLSARPMRIETAQLFVVILVAMVVGVAVALLLAERILPMLGI